jgi:hypothetical protein
MPRSDCEPCCNPTELARAESSFRSAVLQILCNTYNESALAKNPLIKTGSASATFTIVPAVAAKRIKVYSLSLMTTSTSAVTITFKDGAGGTAIGTYTLQAVTGSVSGIVEALDVPSYLFATTAGNLLEMSFSGAFSVVYNLRYWADDAT